MANVTATQLGSLASGSNASTYTIAGTTPGANKTVAVVFENQLAAGALEATTVTCTGLTFSSVATMTFDGGTKRLSLWAGSGAVPLSGNIVVTFAANQDGFEGAAFQGENDNTTTPFPQSKSGTATADTTVATSLNSGLASSESLVMVALGLDDNVTISTDADATWTDALSTALNHASPPSALGVHKKLNDTTANPTTAAGEDWGWLEFEWQSAAGASIPNMAAMMQQSNSGGMVGVSYG